jgi:hypothetical protein
MITAAFELQKWPKRHEHLVEECVAAGRVLHVSDVLPYLTGWHRNVIRSWNPPTHPWLTLVPRMGGPFRLWWFLCPTCRRRCEALYIPPGARPDDHRCRICWGLIYASQRYGHRHSLRNVFTYRKSVTQRKEALHQQRAWARRQSEVVRNNDDRHENDEQWAKEGSRRVAAYLAAREAATAEVRARIHLEADRTLAVLHELAANARSKRVRDRARRRLERYAVDPGQPRAGSA